jgi:hypothetical protein
VFNVLDVDHRSSGNASAFTARRLRARLAEFWIQLGGRRLMDTTQGLILFPSVPGARCRLPPAGDSVQLTPISWGGIDVASAEAMPGRLERKGLKDRGVTEYVGLFKIKPVACSRCATK